MLRCSRSSQCQCGPPYPLLKVVLFVFAPLCSSNHQEFPLFFLSLAHSLYTSFLVLTIRLRKLTIISVQCNALNLAVHAFHQVHAAVAWYNDVTFVVQRLQVPFILQEEESCSIVCLVHVSSSSSNGPIPHQLSKVSSVRTTCWSPLY